MIATCMARQPPRTPLDTLGEWVGPVTLDHDHGDRPIVPISGVYEGPNLVLWTGSIHHVVLALKYE